MIAPLLLSLALATSPVASPQPSMPPPASSSTRLAAETLGGGLGIAAGAWAGGFVGSYVGCARSNHARWCMFSGAGYGIAPGALLGGSLGVQLGGFLADGSASYLGTFVGTAAGLGAGMLLLQAMTAASHGAGQAVMIGTLAAGGLTLTGGVIGFEVGNWVRRRPPMKAERVAIVLPIFTPEGGGVALSGNF